MTETRKIIHAFLASPGDLQEERKAIHSVIKEFNETWADVLGYQVELVGWEETISGYGRPQHLINKDVDRCDLFLGLMWRKWGTPPDVEGKFTSGFHEEFERSVKRRKETEKPEICLFFKEIGEDFMSDMGPDLIKVIQFRDKIISEKSIFFHNFTNISEVEKLIRKSVSHYVNQIKNAEETESRNNYEKQTKSQNIEKSSNRNIEITSPLSPEGFSFLEKFIDIIQKPEAMDNLSNYDIARFRLLSNSISKTGNHESQLGVHDINILFANRNKSVFGNKEIKCLMRFGFQNLHAENTPLWYWYSKQKNSVYDEAVLFSLIGQNDNEKAGAIRVLTLLGIKLPDKGPIKRKQIIDTWFLEGSSAQVRIAALEYFKSNGDSEDFGVVKAEYDRNDYSTSRKALESMISILYKTSKERKAENLILETQFDSLDPSILHDVLTVFSKLETNQLQNGLEHQNSEVRLRSLRVLNERDALSNDIAEKLTTDTDSTIRYEAVRILVKRGKKLSDDEAHEILVKPQKKYGLGILGTVRNADKEGEVYYNKFTFERLCALNEKELIELVNKALVYDDAPYFALVHKYFSKYANELRANIDDKFKDYFDKRIERVEAISNDTKIHDLINKIKKGEDIVRKEITRQGLDILCKNSKLEDINRLRDNLKIRYTSASVLDVEYFHKYGDWNDIKLLADAKGSKIGDIFLTMENNSEFQDSVAKVIYKIGKSSISELFSLEFSSTITKNILEICSESVFRNISDVALFRLLNNKSDDVRKAASMLAVRTFSKKRTKAILDEYVSGDNERYYNVIHWLDLGVSMSRGESTRIVLAENR